MKKVCWKHMISELESADEHLSYVYHECREVDPWIANKIADLRAVDINKLIDHFLRKGERK